MSLRLALGVRGTVGGHRLGALEGGGGGSRPLPMHPCPAAIAPDQSPGAKDPHLLHVTRDMEELGCAWWPSVRDILVHAGPSPCSQPPQPLPCFCFDPLPSFTPCGMAVVRGCVWLCLLPSSRHRGTRRHNGWLTPVMLSNGPQCLGPTRDGSCGLCVHCPCSCCCRRAPPIEPLGLGGANRGM